MAIASPAFVARVRDPLCSMIDKPFPVTERFMFVITIELFAFETPVLVPLGHVGIIAAREARTQFRVVPDNWLIGAGELGSARRFGGTSVEMEPEGLAAAGLGTIHELGAQTARFAGEKGHFGAILRPAIHVHLPAARVAGILFDVEDAHQTPATRRTSRRKRVDT